MTTVLADRHIVQNNKKKKNEFLTFRIE